MKSIRSTDNLQHGALALGLLIITAVGLVCNFAAPARAQRVFGVDTSSVANGVNKPTLAQWQDAYNTGQPSAGINSFQFAFVRSTHGGTNGVSPASDDSHFYDNISNATAAGLLAGSYHYPHPAVYTPADEVTHWINRAGMYMKPGYMIPVFDLEGSDASSLGTAALTTWCNQFIDAVFAAKGFNPIVYSNSSFANDEITASVAFTNVGSSPHTGERTYQWIARPGGSIVTGQPQPALPTYPDPYGIWDPNFTTRSASVDPVVKPWAFWQNGSGYLDPGGTPQFLVDYNAANGNIEFVRDFLIPALWTGGAGGGNWGTVSNWNSDNPAYNGNIANGPAPRLPGYDDTNVVLGSRKYDWVKLQNANNATVTLSSGAQGMRKFYTSQPLNITGGSLTVNYIPGSGGKWDLPSEFNDTVTISGAAAYSAHTTQIDGGGGQFNINGGTVTFTDMQLVSHASNAGKIEMGGNATFAPTGGAGTATIRSTGALAQAGTMALGALPRTLTINDGSAVVDVSIQVAVTGLGGLVKSGPGKLQLMGANSYSGGTLVSAGVLTLTGASATLGSGGVTVSGAGTSLEIQTGVTNAISNLAFLSLLGGGAAGADQGFANLGSGVVEAVNLLLLGGVVQAPGTYGSTSSSATFKNNEYFSVSGTGIITVLIPEPSSIGLMLLGLAALAAKRRSR